jgi:eukaryotic translation initiation factor 2C
MISANVLPQPLSVTVPYFEEDEDQSIAELGKKEYILAIKYIQPIEIDSLQQ